jgi:hypothetical protein
VAPHLLDRQVTDRPPINFQGDQFERWRDLNRDERYEKNSDYGNQQNDAKSF